MQEVRLRAKYSEWKTRGCQRCKTEVRVTTPLRSPSIQKVSARLDFARTLEAMLYLQALENVTGPPNKGLQRCISLS